jgi:hypothetical protein
VRRSDFRLCLIMAAVWAVGLVFYATTRSSIDACHRDCPMAIENSADLVASEIAKGSTIVPTRWTRQRW